MRIRLTTEPDGRICVESPYDPGFVAAFKAAIPWDGREWVASRKRWLLSPIYFLELEALCTQYGAQILDERTGTMQHVLAGPDPYALMPADLRTAFTCLYLAPNAPICVAEASYRALSRVYHPDNTETGNTTYMGEVNDAISTIRRYFA